MKVPLSILIPAKNERANLRACLESARFAAEIVVVDSDSSDGTREIAEEFGATVVNFAWDGRFPKKKNWALANVPWRHEWVFILDADERITPALAAEIEAVLAAPTAAGYYINRRFWFLDGWLNHCGYFPSWNLRLFRHRLGRYEQSGQADAGSGDNEVHEHVILSGAAGRLRHEMEHYAFPTIEIWVEKHNRYSNWEARQPSQQARPEPVEGARSEPVERARPELVERATLDPGLARKRRLKGLASRMPFRPALRFGYHYVLRAGFLDGYRGFVFCRLMAFYEFLSVAKAAELRRRRRPEA